VIDELVDMNNGCAVCCLLASGMSASGPGATYLPNHHPPRTHQFHENPTQHPLLTILHEPTNSTKTQPSIRCSVCCLLASGMSANALGAGHTTQSPSCTNQQIPQQPNPASVANRPTIWRSNRSPSRTNPPPPRKPNPVSVANHPARTHQPHKNSARHPLLTIHHEPTIPFKNRPIIRCNTDHRGQTVVAVEHE
jgi:hypothetical protein